MQEVLMKVWMISDMIYVDENGLQWLRSRKIYEVPDSWGKLIVNDGEVACEYIKIGGKQ